MNQGLETASGPAGTLLPGSLPHIGSLSYDELRSMTVLIVDDVPDNVDLLKTMLSKSGFTHLITAASGKEALQRLRDQTQPPNGSVDVVILDNMMPEMDGYEVCRTVRRVDLMPRIISALARKKERDLRKRREQELETELAERRIMEARLQHLVSHDDLTGLYNRRRLEQQLEIAVLRARKKQRLSALLYIDLDYFKVINDAEGHITGDSLLIEVANVLRHEIGLNDVLARVSADEYAVLLENVTEVTALETAERLRNVLDDYHYHSNDRTYHIGASIGVALIQPGEVTSASEILARADQACYVAKTHGRNVVHLFNKEDTEMVTLRSAIYWVPLIRDALAYDKFKLVFQPVLDIKQNQVSHYESLIRMVGSDGRLITPNHFIPVAEHMGLIHDIDLWVVSHAFDVLQQLPPHQSHIAMNINLSSYAFQDKSLLPMLRRKLEQTGVQAQRITFEITETAAIANYAQT